MGKKRFDYIGAVNEGYSNEEIQQYLNDKGIKFDLVGAVNEGYEPQEIDDYLNTEPQVKKKETPKAEGSAFLGTTTQSLPQNTKTVQSNGTSQGKPNWYDKYIPEEYRTPEVLAKVKNIARTSSPSEALNKINQLKGDIDVSTGKIKTKNVDKVISDNKKLIVNKNYDFNEQVNQNYDQLSTQVKEGNIQNGYNGITPEQNTEIKKLSYEGALQSEAGQRRQSVFDAETQIEQQVSNDIDRFGKFIQKTTIAPNVKEWLLENKNTAKDLVVSPTSHPTFLKEYTKIYKTDIERQREIELDKLSKSTPFSEKYSELDQAIRPEYQAKINEINNKYNESISKYQTKLSPLAKIKASTIVLQEGLANKKMPDVSKIGSMVLESLGVPEYEKAERLKSEGVGLTPDQKIATEKVGNEALKDFVSVYKPSADEGNPASKKLVALANHLIKTNDEILKDNPEFVNKQVSEAISNEIANNPKEYYGVTINGIPTVGVQQTFGLYDINDEMIAKAGKKLGIPQEYYSRITDKDIKSGNILGSFTSGAIGETALGIGGLSERLSNLSKGYSLETSNELANRWEDKAGFWKGLYNPASASNIQEDATIVDLDKTSDTYLQNIKNPDAGSWNLNISTVLDKMFYGGGMILGLGKGGSSMGKLMQSARLLNTEAGLINKAEKALELGYKAESAIDRAKYGTEATELLAKSGKASELADQLGMFTYGYMSGFDRNYRTGLTQFEGQPNADKKALVYAGMYSFIENAVEQMGFSEVKFVRGLSKTGTQRMTDLVERITSEGINSFDKKTLKENLISVIKSGIKVGGDITAEVAEEISTNIGDVMIKMLTGANKDPNADFLKDQWNTAVHTVIQMALTTGLGEIRQKSPMRENVQYQVALQPEAVRQAIKEQEKAGKINTATAIERMKTVNTLVELNNEIPQQDPISGKVLSTKEKIQYLNEGLKERLANHALEKTTDEVQKKRYEQIIKEAQESKIKILETPTSEEQANALDNPATPQGIGVIEANGKFTVVNPNGTKEVFDTKGEADARALEIANPKNENKVVENIIPIEDRKRKDLFPDESEFADVIGESGKNSNISSYREVNGIGISEYTNPDNGVVDVIMSGTSDNDYVGYVRIYENGKPTERWTSKMENKSGNKDNFKTMISEVQKLLPQGHEYTEKTNISLDGLRVYANQLKRGYEIATDENGDVITNNVELNNATLAALQGAKTESEVSSLYDKKTGITKEEFDVIKDKINSLIPNTRVLFNSSNGSVIIKLPVLKSKTENNATQNTQTPSTESTTINGQNELPKTETTVNENVTETEIGKPISATLEGKPITIEKTETGYTYTTPKGRVLEVSETEHQENIADNSLIIPKIEAGVSSTDAIEVPTTTDTPTAETATKIEDLKNELALQDVLLTDSREDIVKKIHRSLQIRAELAELEKETPKAVPPTPTETATKEATSSALLKDAIKNAEWILGMGGGTKGKLGNLTGGGYHAKIIIEELKKVGIKSNMDTNLSEIIEKIKEIDADYDAELTKLDKETPKAEIVTPTPTVAVEPTNEVKDKAVGSGVVDVVEPKSYAEATDAYKATELGSSEDAKNKKQALVEQAETEEGKKFVESEVSKLEKNDDGTITVFRSGTLQEGHNPATTSRKTAEIIAAERKKQGLSSDIVEVRVNPSDISVVVKGIESEVFVKVDKSNKERIEQNTTQKQKTKTELLSERDEVQKELEKTRKALDASEKAFNDGTYPFSENVFKDANKKQKAKIKNLEWQLSKIDKAVEQSIPTQEVKSNTTTTPIAETPPALSDVESTAKALEEANKNKAERFYPDDKVILTTKDDKEVEVSFRGYNGENKAVIFGSRGSGINQIEVDVSQLRAKSKSDKLSKEDRKELLSKIDFQNKNAPSYSEDFNDRELQDLSVKYPKESKLTNKEKQERNDLQIATTPLKRWQEQEYGVDDLNDPINIKLAKEHETAINNIITNPKYSNLVSEAYHKAKADGSNPELVKAVESLLSKEQTIAETPISQTKNTENETPRIADNNAENELAVGKLQQEDNPIAEPIIEVIEGEAESNDKAKLNEVIAKVDELVNNATDVVNVPISEIKINEKEYQGRKKAFSERSANKVHKFFSRDKFNPIIIYKHPDGNTYVLSGHSRLEGMKRRGESTIPARYFEGNEQYPNTPEGAKKFAMDSNKDATLQTDLENSDYYRGKLKSGSSYNAVLVEAKENEQEGSAVRIIDYAHLNPKGKAYQALEALEKGESDTSTNVKLIAQKVGRIRSQNEHLTDAHEQELFDYFSENGYPTDKEIQDPNGTINRSINAVRFDPKEPLNLNKFVAKTAERIEWEKELKELENLRDELKKEVNPSKQSGWSGLKEKVIASLAKGKSKEQIDQAEKDFNSNKDNVKTNYEKKLAEQKQKLQGVNDKIAKHLLREKSLIQGEKNQGSLFSTSKPKKSITKEAFTALTDMLKKAFPKVEFIGRDEAEKILADKGIVVNEIRTTSGNVFGFEANGKVWLDETLMNADTPIHEVVGHYGMNIIDAQSRGGDAKATAVILKGFALLKEPEGKAVLDEVMANPAYANLSERKQKLEALATIIGREGAVIFEEGTKDTKQSKTFASKVKAFVNSFYEYLKSKIPTLKDKSIEDIQRMDNKEFIRAIIGDAFRGEIVADNTPSEGINLSSEPNANSPISDTNKRYLDGIIKDIEDGKTTLEEEIKDIQYDLPKKYADKYIKYLNDNYTPKQEPKTESQEPINKKPKKVREHIKLLMGNMDFASGTKEEKLLNKLKQDTATTSTEVEGENVSGDYTPAELTIMQQQSEQDVKALKESIEKENYGEDWVDTLLNALEENENLPLQGKESYKLNPIKVIGITNNIAGILSQKRQQPLSEQESLKLAEQRVRLHNYINQVAREASLTLNARRNFRNIFNLAKTVDIERQILESVLSEDTIKEIERINEEINKPITEKELNKADNTKTKSEPTERKTTNKKSNKVNETLRTILKNAKLPDNFKEQMEQLKPKCK